MSTYKTYLCGYTSLCVDIPLAGGGEEEVG